MHQAGEWTGDLGGNLTCSGAGVELVERLEAEAVAAQGDIALAALSHYIACIGLGVVPGRRLALGFPGAFCFSGEHFQLPA